MLIDGKEISKLAYKDIVNEIKIITKKSKNKDVNCLILDKYFLKSSEINKIKKEKYFYTIKNKKDFKKYSNSNLIFENL